jgi:glycosyltransferase involved in cell wall biosynthesis
MSADGPPLRLCFVTREYPPVTAYTGGIGTHYAVLAPELARLGHEVHVITLRDRPDVEELERGVHLHLLRPPRAPLRALANIEWSAAVDRALRGLGRFDAVYAAEWGGDASRYARRKHAGPLVTNLTSSYVVVLDVSDGRGSLRGRIGLATQGALERRQAERSDAIVACSRAILERLRVEWDIGDVPTVVLPNTVDIARTRSLAASGETPEGFPADGPIVGFSGRLQSHKGVEELVQAMRVVWDTYPEARLVMLGADRGRMSRALREQAGKYADRLHLLGNQPAERLFPALAAADVIAMPSRWESFPIAALEAMALGRPMVVTRGFGFDEFLEDGSDGLMVPLRDPAALASALLRLLSEDELCGRIGARARETAERYDAPVVARLHADYFRQLAAEHRR